MSNEYAKKHFLILINKVESEQKAQEIYNNISKVARQYLSVSLEVMGCILNDEKLRRSTQLCRPVVDAFPDAISSAGFRQLAEDLLHCSYTDDYDGGVENFMRRLIRTSHLREANITV